MDTSGLWRLLLDKTDRELDLGNFIGSSGGFSHWQRIVDPLYYQRPVEERLAVAFSLVRSRSRPDVVRRALGVGSLPPLTSFDRGKLLVHVAEWAGWVMWFTLDTTFWSNSMFADPNPKASVTGVNEVHSMETLLDRIDSQWSAAALHRCLFLYTIASTSCMVF